MQVKTVKATVRKAVEKQGGWYTIELGAEATLTKGEGEKWEEHQADLVAKLREDVVLAMRGHRPNSQQPAVPAAKTPATPATPATLEAAATPEAATAMQVPANHQQNGSKPASSDTPA